MYVNRYSVLICISDVCVLSSSYAKTFTNTLVLAVFCAEVLEMNAEIDWTRLESSIYIAVRHI